MESVVLLIFFLSRTLATIIAFFAHQFDSYNEIFHFKFQLYHNNSFIPKFLISFANYDGAQYLRIAHSGYGQFQQAFFPLFPLLIHMLSPFFGGGYFLTGILISNISFLVGLFLFKKLLSMMALDKKTILWTLLLFVSFPTSFFFMSVYTESLFFLLFAATLYALHKKHYVTMALLGIAASLSRLIGVFLIIPIATSVIFDHLAFNIQNLTTNKITTYVGKFIVKNLKYLFAILSPILGLLLYMLYLHQTTGDWIAFYHAEHAFGVQRSAHIILLPQIYVRYVKIFLTSQHTFIFAIAALEFLVFNAFLFVLTYDLVMLMKNRSDKNFFPLLGLNLFSFCNLLLPTFTGSFSSMPRYVLLSFSFFTRLAMMKNIFLKTGILAIFILSQAILLWLFIQGYFIS